MQIAEYFDSIAGYWDDDFAESKPARYMTAAVSIPRGGACVLDVGCGSGSMFLDLMENGACEIEGIDISQKMADIAREKYLFDPRIHAVQGDFLAHETKGYDVITAFNVYQHFLQPRLFLKKARDLLRPKGRLTVAFPFDRMHTNTLSALLPAGIARGILSAEEESAFWLEYFDLDCICDTDGLYLISGTAK